MADETYFHPDPAQVSEDISSLKRFTSGGRGPWHAISDSDWNDWRWQLKRRINNLEQLESVVPDLSLEEIQGA